MPKKKRRYEDFMELGFHLHNARDALMDAHLKSGAALGKTTPRTKKLQKLIESLDELRCQIDNDYCKEPFSLDVPKGLPEYPIYLHVWLENNPVERLRLEGGVGR